MAVRTGIGLRTWANTLGVTVGAGVLAGAGQLGIGYGLGIVRWDRDFPTPGPWHAQLTWVAFLTSVAVIAGGYAGSWFARHNRVEPTLAVRVGLALAAALGALVVLPLVIRPAGSSHPPEAGDPRLVAALTVVAGLLIGIIAAFAGLSVPAVSGSIVTTVLWLWIVALISAASSLGGGASWATARLGLLPAGGIWVPLTLLVPAALISLGVAGIARFGGSDAWAVGVCGAAGPALVGLAYLIAGPSGGSDRTAYSSALFAILAGVAVSVAVAVVRRRPARPAAETATAPPAEALTEDLGRLHPLEGVQESKISTPEALEPPAEPEPTPTPEPAAEAKPPAQPEPPAQLEPAAKAEAQPEPPTQPEPAAKAEPPTQPEPAAKAKAQPKAPAKAQPKAEARPEAQPEAEARPEARPEAEPAAETEPASQPAPAAAEPAPKERTGQGIKVPGLGRRSRRRAETPVPAAETDSHLDWVKGLRAEETPARVGGNANPRHAKAADPPPATEDEG